MESLPMDDCERYKKEIYIQDESHGIIVDHLRRQVEKLTLEIRNLQNSINESLEKYRERVLMLQSDREVHLMDLLNLRLRERNEEIRRGQMEAATRELIEREKEEFRRETMVKKIQRVYRLFIVQKRAKAPRNNAKSKTVSVKPGKEKSRSKRTNE